MSIGIHDENITDYMGENMIATLNIKAILYLITIK